MSPDCSPVRRSPYASRLSNVPDAKSGDTRLAPTAANASSGNSGFCSGVLDSFGCGSARSAIWTQSSAKPGPAKPTRFVATKTG